MRVNQSGLIVDDVIEDFEHFKLLLDVTKLFDIHPPRPILKFTDAIDPVDAEIIIPEFKEYT